MQKCTKCIIKITAYEKQNVSSYIKIVNTLPTAMNKTIGSISLYQPPNNSWQCWHSQSR